MKVRTCAALLAAITFAPRAWAIAATSSSDELSAIEVHPGVKGGTVTLHGSRPPVFSVFRLSGPDRIVVDLAGVDVSKAKAPASGIIRGLGDVSAVQFQKGDTRVGRVVLSADPKLAFDVKVVGNDVVVALSDTEAAGSVAAPIPAASAGAVGADANEKSSAGDSLKAPERAVPAANDEHLLSSLTDEGHGRASGHRILSATSAGQPLSLAIRTDGTIGEVTVLRLRAPNRIAIDLPGFDAKGAKAKVGGAASAVRFGKAPGGTRVVFDLASAETPDVTWKRTPNGLVISAQAKATPPPAVASAAKSSAEVARPVSQARPAKQPAPAQATAVSPDRAAQPTVPEQAMKPQPRPVAPAVATSLVPAAPAVSPAVATQYKKAKVSPPREVGDLRITGDSAVQEVVLELPDATKLAAPRAVDGSGYELQLHGLTVPERLRRTLDASAFSGPVSTVSSFNVGQGEGRIVVSVAPGSRQELAQDGRTVTWRFSKAPQAKAEISIDSAKVAAAETEAGESQVAGFTTAASEASAETPRRTHYTGRRISLEFKDIDIQNLLRLFADISHKNIVVADNVKGKVTIALRNVPWDQAFDLILKTHGLGKEESGNIVRVALEDELEKERKAALEAKKARELLEPLRVRLIPVNYALAGDVADKIKDVLSERGVVTVDGRTNVLIVKDVPDNLAKAEGMVRNLDTQTPQVLIEARIVEASTQFNREVGIQWGGNGGFAPVYANSTGLVFPNTATVAGAAGGTPNSGTASNPNYAVNLPAAIGQGAGGGIGFIFGSAGGAVNLNLRISALESNGIVKTVSAPKVATLDNQEADISQGVSIPFAQVSAAGVQTAFIEARLELKVTPHVTSDGSVLLKINASNNQPNSGITGANGQPSISRKEAKTQMLVRDGDTSVIGGIYTRQTGVSVNQVPLFGSIPILGWLFKNRNDSDQRTELLVFITPRILNRQQIVASGN